MLKARLLPMLSAMLALSAFTPAAQDRHEGALRGGDVAPDFTLEPRDGGVAVTLSSFRSRMPVALVFGSYT